MDKPSDCHKKEKEVLESVILAAMWKIWKREGEGLSFEEWLYLGKNEGCEINEK